MPSSSDNDSRLWQALDKIADRLTGIETKLSDIVRLEERMNGHESAISRYGKRLDNHDSRLREVELNQANHGDNSTTELLLSNLKTELHNIKDDVSKLQTSTERSSGRRDILKEVLKAVVVILTGILIYKFTRG